MDGMFHLCGEELVDLPMALEGPATLKLRGNDGHHEVSAARGRSGMTGMFGAVVADLEQGRVQRGLERDSKAVGARHAHEGSLANAPRSRYRMTPNRKTMASGMEIQSLNLTQSASLRVMATQMFAKPSST